MSGVVSALFMRRSAHLSLTVGTSGGVYGYNAGDFGSLTPSSAFGSTVNLLYANPGGQDFLLNLNGVHAQSLFSHITVEDGTGIKRTYLSSAATFSVIGGTETQWAWGDGSSPVWSSGDETEVHSVVIG